MSKVSVIVPVYNVEPYLRRCVDSILAQTLTDIEIILVNDGSSDSCPSICDEYAVNESRVKVIHKENGGLSSARNAGLDSVTGEYVAFIDSDDYIAADMYERLLSALLEADADISICGFQRVGENHVPAAEKISFFDTVLTGKQALENLYTNDYIYFTSACNKLFIGNLFTGYRFPEGKLFEDGYAAFRYYFDSKKVVCLSGCFYFYLTRTNSITTSLLSVKNLDGLDAEVDSIEFLIEKGCSDLVVKAQTKYFAALIYNLKRFDLNTEGVHLKFREIHRDFRRLYSGIMKNPTLSGKEKWLVVFFRVSPRLCKWVIKVKKL